jgi:hypothetical protein
MKYNFEAKIPVSEQFTEECKSINPGLIVSGTKTIRIQAETNTGELPEAKVEELKEKVKADLNLGDEVEISLISSEN